MQYYWIAILHDEGPIVEVSEAQLEGEADGVQGKARGVSLRYDRSDRTWTVYRGKKEIANGTGDAPSVEDAMKL